MISSISPLEVLGALAVGLALGLLGGGGSILTVPVLVFAVGLGPKAAVAASLPIVAITSGAAALSHWRQGNVQVRTAIVFGLVAAVGGFAGARLAAFMSGAMQFSLLGIVMLAAAFRMLIGNVKESAVDGTNKPIPYAKLVPIALVVGVITGVVGIGGGFLILPTLVILCQLPMRLAVGTSLLVIAMNATSGAAGYAGQVPVDWPAVALFSVFAVAGSLTASQISSRIPQAGLKKAFGVLLIALAVVILVQNRHVFSGLLPS
ncbi:MAG: sulfite exporter TauE/SafE family protein [Gemmatimonadaceae bacterium]